MNTEQERKDFEAWFKETDHFLSELDFCLMPDGRYEDDDVEVAWEAYQAGRAALQSQDREDALTDAIREAIKLLGPDAPICSGCEYEWNHALRVLREAIDHARKEQL